MDIQFMKENFKMENFGEKDRLLFKMVQCIKVFGKMIKLINYVKIDNN